MVLEEGQEYEHSEDEDSSEVPIDVDDDNERRLRENSLSINDGQSVCEDDSCTDIGEESKKSFVEINLIGQSSSS